MSGVNFSRPLVGAGASISNDVASAAATTGIDFAASAELNRGFKAELGITAFADASAGLSKFIAAQIKGTALASARVGVQGQLALNLFKEFGFIVRAEAVAEAAVGVEGKLGIKVGDFINLVLKDKSNAGLPVELLLMLLDEVDIGASFFIDIAASAKANCAIGLSGTLLPKPGQQAGFNLSLKAGVGLAAGVGMGFKAGIGFKDFRRFYGRAIDKSVDQVIDQINGFIPTSAKAICPYVTAFGPLAKISLRLSYDMGKKIIENTVGRSAADAQNISNECVNIILEEIQRFSLEKLAELSFHELKALLTSGVNNAAAGAWQAASSERNALANLLSAIPNEPFQPSLENIDYWKDLILKAVKLIEKLFPGATVDPKLAQQITILYCATELSLEAIRSKVNNASTYATAIGLGTVSSNTKPFTASLSEQPPAFIKKEINTKIARPVGTQIAYVDLLEYLVDDLILENALTKIPALKAFIGIFTTDFNKTERELLKLLLENSGSFVQNGNGAIVPKDSLRPFVKSIDTFLTGKFKREVMIAVQTHVADPVLRTYIEEVFLACVISTKDITLNAALNWEQTPYTNEQLTEMLGGVMIMFLGRSLVLLTDTLVTAVQNEVQENCGQIATAIENKHSNLPIPVKNLLKDDGFRELAADSIRIGGEVLGPLPEDTRKRMRYLLYQIFDTVPPGKESIVMDRFKDRSFIPNQDQLKAMCDEMLEISKDRFGLFVQKMLVNIGEFILQELQDLLEELKELALKWEKELLASLSNIASELKTLEAKRVSLNRQLISQYGAIERAFDGLISKLSSTEIKRSIKKDLVEKFIRSAETQLNRNPIYEKLPKGGKDIAKNALRGAVDIMLNNPVIDPIFHAIDTLGNGLDDLMPEMKDFNPRGNMPEQLLTLVLDNIERKLRQQFGRQKPGIDIRFIFSFGVDIDIKLGRIEVDLSWFIGIVRSVIRTANVYQNQLNTTINKLGDFVGTNLELVATELRRDDLKTREVSIKKIADELSNKPKEIKILSPTHMATYETDVPIKIHFGGVPKSYLGLDTDELQRVHIFLNGKSIPPKSLQLTTSVASTSTSIVADREILTPNAINPTLFTRNAALFTDTSLTLPRSGTAASHAPNTNSPPILSARLASTNRPDKKLLESLVKISTLNSLSKKGSPIITHTLSPIATGLVMDSQTMTAIVKESLPGLLLQFTALSKDLVVGVNVLTAIVIDKAGTRHQQNLSFMLVATTTSTTNPKGKNNLLLRPVTKSQMAEGIKSAKTYAVQQNSLHFKNI